MGYVKKIKDMTRKEVQDAGGKAANLGEMTKNGFNIPGGFCVTAASLPYHVSANALKGRIDAIKDSCNFESYADVEEKSAQIRELIIQAPMPEDLVAELQQQIADMRDELGNDPFVAVRSSVAVRGSTISSFPGMMDTYHFVRGEEEIVAKVKECWASLWTARAAYRRHQQHIAHDRGLIAPVVQKMVSSDVAGVMFTANAITGNREEVVIEAVWGLGEGLVSGEATVDYFILGKKPPHHIKVKKVQKKNIMVTLDRERGIGRKKCDVTGEMITDCTLCDEQLRQLAVMATRFEEVFGYPQDVEWAYENGELFILQSRNIQGLKD